jgi:DNA (cytosine-5)-methyltransferase 1
MARVIHEVQPRFVFVENSPMLTSRGLGTVLGDLATMGFDARWGVLGASDVGAKHERKRIWIVARQPKFLSHTQHNRIGWWKQQQESIEEKTFNMANTNDSDWRREHRRFWSVQKCNQEWDSYSTFNQPEPIRMVDGVANRVDRLKAIGNGQVPLCAATAWRILSEPL